MKRYKVTLTTEERCELRDLIAAGKAAAKEVGRTRGILLKADASPGGPAWTDQRIAEAVEDWRRWKSSAGLASRFVEEGLASSLGPARSKVEPTQPRSAASSMAGPKARPDRLGLLRSATAGRRQRGRY